MASKEAPRLFGTDGVRGEANGKLTPELALKIGQAAGTLFRQGGHRHRVLVGKDTRLSGYMIECALTAGFVSAGMDVLQTGPIPTPGVAMMTRSMRADLGVMISASHNPFADNGIKLFGPDGYKLTDELERQIEEHVASDLVASLARGKDIGRVRRIDGVQDRYIENAKKTLPPNIEFDGLRVVIDCANGAAYKVAPQVLRELGAEVVTMGVDPDGLNINSECGSTAPGVLRRLVRERRADIGIALDGDADRVVLVDEKGSLIDGDQLLAVIASSWKADGRLVNPHVVGTVMSNLGLQRHLAGLDISFTRSPVGDRFVLEEMRDKNCALGGEPSGHIIMSDYATTGDGLVAALQALAVVMQSGKRMSEIAHRFEPVPQILRNVRIRGDSSRVLDAVKDVIATESERLLSAGGRFLVRPSGTEPVIRVMGEGDDAAAVEKSVAAVVAALEAAS